MRVLPGALSAEAKRSCGGDQPPAARPAVSGKARVLPILSLILGGLLGGIYVRLVFPSAGYSLYATGILGGACGLFLLLVIPRMTWVVLKIQWFQLALRFTEARLEQLLSRAQATLGAAQAGGSPEAASDLGVVHCLRGDYAAAVTELQRPHEPGESTVWAGNLLAVLAARGEWSAVAGLVDRELNRPGGLTDPNLARVAAEAPYGRLIERLWLIAQDGSLPLTLNNIGVRLLQLGDFMRAEDAFAVVKQQHPSYALGRANAGVLAYRREDFAQAVTELGSAAALENGDGLIFNNLGGTLCRAGDLPRARLWLHRAQALLPNSADVLVNLGNVQALAGAHQEALETFSTASRLAPHAAAHHNAALMLAARDHLDAALAEQQLAQQAAPESPEVQQNLGCLLWAKGRYDEARQCFRHPSHSAYDTTVKSNVIRAELGAGEPRRALDLLLLVTYTEEDMDFDRGLAHLLTAVKAGGSERGDQVRERDLVEAVAHFDRVVKANRAGAVEAQINLGLALYLSEDYDDAAEALKRAATRAPQYGLLSYAVAVCFLTAAARVREQSDQPFGPLPPRSRELLRAAVPFLEASLAVRSIADNVRFNLGVLRYLLEEYDQAATVLRPIARADSPWQILNVLGISQARQARELHRSVQSSVLLSMTRKRQIEEEIAKLLSTAIHSFTQVLRQQPDNVIAHANIGLAQYLRNRGDDVEQALQHWRRMRDIGGEWGRRVFELFSGAVGSEEAKNLTFQDVEISFRPLPLEEWVVCAPPRMAGLQFPILELPDVPPPELAARHPLVKRALALRDRAERLRKALQRLRT